MKRATGEITVTSVGIDSPVTVRNIRMVWPLLVRRSSSLRAWVIQITAVSATRMPTKALKAIRKI